MDSVSRHIAKPRALTLKMNLVWSAILTSLALSTVYLVGMEPKPILHNAFHDLRHATGFQCH